MLSSLALLWPPVWHWAVASGTMKPPSCLVASCRLAGQTLTLPATLAKAMVYVPAPIDMGGGSLSLLADCAHLDRRVCVCLCMRQVGDHEHSWAYDGARQQKWNGEPSDYGAAWGAGDVVGCLVDTLTGTVSFSLNGKDLGAAWTGVAALTANADGSVPRGLHPALSLEKGEVVQINIGQVCV